MPAESRAGSDFRFFSAVPALIRIADCSFLPDRHDFLSRPDVLFVQFLYNKESCAHAAYCRSGSDQFLMALSQENGGSQWGSSARVLFFAEITKR